MSGRSLLMTLDYELLLGGGALLALCLVPIGPVQRFGRWLLGFIFKLSVHSPVPSVLPGTISLLLLIGGWGLLCATYLFNEWYGEHVRALSDSKKVLESVSTGKRWRAERNMVMWACTAAVYLSLHTIARLSAPRPTAPTVVVAAPAPAATARTTGGPAATTAAAAAATDKTLAAAPSRPSAVAAAAVPATARSSSAKPKSD